LWKKSNRHDSVGIAIDDFDHYGFQLSEVAAKVDSVPLYCYCSRAAVVAAIVGYDG